MQILDFEKGRHAMDQAQAFSCVLIHVPSRE